MTADLLRETAERAIRFLETADRRHVGGRVDRAALLEALGGPVPEDGADPAAVIARLAEAADPGIVASAGPRYFGFVTGGAVPVTVAADWLASAWDQNGALYVDVAGRRRDRGRRLALAARDARPARARERRLRHRLPHGELHRAWPRRVTRCCAAPAGTSRTQGLQRAPRVRVIAGGEVHISAVGALRYPRVRRPTRSSAIPVDGQGRMRADALAPRSAGRDAGPTIVCAQAGNVSTGASDPLDGDRRRARTHAAPGCTSTARSACGRRPFPSCAAQIDGHRAGADSWATDAHKWLNVPYDSGLAIVADAAPHRAAMSLKASYLQRGADEERVGMDWVPESSRRARVLPLYALIRTLGATASRRWCAATARSRGAWPIGSSQRRGVRSSTTWCLNQVLVRFGDGRRGSRRQHTRDVIARVQAEGTCWAGGAFWQGKQAMRISVSNWSTTEADIDRSADAILRCYRSG